MQNRKRRRLERPTIHPRNKYSENPPDFRLLASLYPSFEPFVFYSRDGRPRIDWTDFNATRELTRVLLDHDHGVKWWIPDGQLCPTVPNRSNYIHWIEDLLSSDIIAKANPGGDEIKGFDIGTGANCIYPILGASLFSWSFVGSDVTDVALEWAERNVKNNPRISELIEIRKVGIFGDTLLKDETVHDQLVSSETKSNLDRITEGEVEPLPSNSVDLVSDIEKYYGPPLLLGVVKDGENFDFCMCNPPFFETMDKAGLNPKTSCGGTPEEMVCPGGERAFITRIIEDSVFLKHTFRWYSSMIGRKSNLKILIAKLRDAGVTVVRTTEFVQGQTCRWGLAWSFMPLIRKTITSNWSEKNNQSFVLEGLQHQSSAIQVLKSIESFFVSSGASCASKSSSFVIDVTASNDHCCSILENGLMSSNETGSSLHPLLDKICFRVSVFQQIPGTLLVKGSLQHGYKTVSGVFSLIFQRLEEILKMEFCRVGSLVDH